MVKSYELQSIFKLIRKGFSVPTIAAKMNINTSNATIVITGGHVTPALALIDELEKRGGWDIRFVGRKYGMEGDRGESYEYKEIRKRKIPFTEITTGRLQRTFTIHTVPSLLKVFTGLWQSFWLLKKLKPCGIVSFGGYIAVPVAISAFLLRIPIITHEQTVRPGLSNRIISKFCSKICISWPETQKYFPKEKTILTGNPLRKEFLEGKSHPVEVKDDKPIIYITGGSLGSNIINRTTATILEKLLAEYCVIHQCGDSKITHDLAYLEGMKAQLPADLSKRYIVRPHFSPEETVWIFKHAPLVVSRSGANTITELLFMGTPALLIPLPHAGANEQYENARMLKKIGVAEILEQKDLTSERLFKTIQSMIQRRDEYAKKSRVARALVKEDAPKRIFDVIQSTLCHPRKTV